ncbi:MAG TPA: asparagine synthase-related protein [Kofleriaceae bacterium]|nr:asparagine synthase-related protein [Kofleriaceae bacterium]
MCGIAGAVGGTGASRLDAVRAMMQRMVHRGPDSTGVAEVGEAALGMCQLRIREAAPRRVPLAMRRTHDARIAYNGEVYAGSWLAGPARRVPGTVDEEVEAIAAQDTGQPPPDGMFAMATAAPAGRAITAWRDSFGIKPLYLRTVGGATYVASEVQALAGLGQRPPVRRAAIAELLLYGRCLGHDTFHDGIHSAAPGTRLEIGAGGVASSARQPAYWRAAPAAGDELRAAIREALEATLISERRVGLALSGGLDSTILAAELSLLGARDLHTFSVRVEGADDGCADLASLELPGEAWKSWTHHVIPFGPDMLPAGLARATALAAEPTRMTSFPLYLALAEAAHAAGVVVVLCGEGADELFGGYGSYRRWTGIRGPIGIDDLARYACPPDKEAALRPILGDAAIDEARCRFDAQFEDCATRAPFDGLRRLEQYLRLEPLLHRTDLALMALSIEGRVPYLHGRVPELAYGLELTDCLSAEQTKLALRRAYASVLPMARAEAPKTNFRAPVTDWFAGRLAPWLRTEMQMYEDSLVEHGLRRDGVRAVVHRTLGGDRHAAAIAFGLVSLGMFLDRDHGRGTTEDPDHEPR